MMTFDFGQNSYRISDIGQNSYRISDIGQNFGHVRKMVEQFEKTHEHAKNFHRKTKKEQKNIIKNTMIYNVPLLKGFHAHKKLEITVDNKDKVYKNFGLNWWDLYYNGLTPEHLGLYKIEKKLKNLVNAEYIGIILMNVGKSLVTIENTENGDIYHIKPNEYSFYNTHKQNIINATCNGKPIMINSVIVGYANYILVGIEDLLDGSSKIIDSPLYTNFLLGSGVINPEIYYNTVGLNANLNRFSFTGKYELDIDYGAQFGEFVRLLEEHWANSVEYLKDLKVKVKDSKVLKNSKRSNKKKKVSKKISKTETIPLKIHWIWLTRDPVDGVSKKESSVIEYEKFMRTWPLRNPNCSLNIWTNTDPNMLSVPFEGINIRPLSDINDSINKIPKELQKNIKKIIHKHLNVGIKADTLRQVILYTEGGLYCDINDMCCLAPLEPYMNTFNFIAGVENQIYSNNAIIGSSSGHEIPKRFLYFLNENCETMFSEWPEMSNAPADERDNWTVSMSGPIAFSSILFGAFDDYYNNEKDLGLEKTVIFPSKFLYSNYEVADDSKYWLVPTSLTSHFDGRTFL